ASRGAARSSSWPASSGPQASPGGSSYEPRSTQVPTFFADDVSCLTGLQRLLATVGGHAGEVQGNLDELPLREAPQVAVRGVGRPRIELAGLLLAVVRHVLPPGLALQCEDGQFLTDGAGAPFRLVVLLLPERGVV